MERIARRTRPSESEVWTRRKIFARIESRMWTTPFSSWGVFAQGAARVLAKDTLAVPPKPASYSTPNCQAEKQKLLAIVVSCLPAAASFQSSRKGTPSRKLNNFCRVNYTDFPGRAGERSCCQGGMSAIGAQNARQRSKCDDNFCSKATRKEEHNSSILKGSMVLCLSQDSGQAFCIFF